MSKVDLSNLSFAELQAVIEDAQALVKDKRLADLQVLIDAWTKEAQEIGFSVSAVIDVFKTRLSEDRPDKTRAAKGTVVKAVRPYVKGAVYKNPNSAETWIGGSTGRQPPWLRELTPESLSLEDRTKKFASLAVKQK
jgi:DNA-binding protein H-NS